MYPQRELRELASAREILRRRIAAHRAQCVESAAGVAAPLALMDRGLAIWRQFSPLIKTATVPLALFLKRKFAPVTSVVDAVLRWAPAVLASFRPRR